MIGSVLTKVFGTSNERAVKRLLPAVESATLRRLSVFAGPFALEAAAAVASGVGVSQAEIVEALADLVAKSLIAPSGTRPPGLWSIGAPGPPAGRPRSRTCSPARRRTPTPSGPS